MTNQKPKKLTRVKNFKKVIIKDYRTPNKHYLHLKNQLINSELASQVRSNLRHSLTDEYETRLSYL